MDITSIASPCVTYHGDLLRCDSVTFTDDLNTSSISVHKSLQGQFTAASNSKYAENALNFVQNVSMSEDESQLLLKIPRYLTEVQLSFVIDRSLIESDVVETDTSSVLYDELSIFKLKSDKDIDIVTTEISKEKLNSFIDSEVPIGTVRMTKDNRIILSNPALSPQELPQSVVHGNLHKLHKSFPLKNKHQGKVTFYLMHKVQGRFVFISKIYFFREEVNEKRQSMGSIGTVSKQEVVQFNEDTAQFPLTDGPDFRQLVSSLEEKIPQMKYLVGQILNTGKLLETSLLENAEAKVNFINTFKKIAANRKVVKELISNKLEPMIRESANDDEKFLNNLKINLLTPLNRVPAVNNINALSSNKKIFEDESQKFYAWLNKYLSSGKSRDEKFLGKKKSFELSKFDYLNYLNEVGNNSQANFEFVNYLITFINNVDNRQHLVLAKPSKDILNSLELQENKRKHLRRKIDDAKSDEELDQILNSSYSDDAKKLFKAGILYTHGGQGKQGWHKQWVVLNEGSLIEYSDWRTGKEKRGSLLDISLCSIKPIVHDKRKNCFEIITSKGTRNVFQTTSESERDSWIKLLYDAGQLIRFGGDLKQSTQRDMRRRRVSSVSLKNLTIVQNIDSSNLTCCDCGDKEGVEWISLNLLVIFCVKCSSVHRNLGTSISKVRSLKLDNFTNEQLSLILNIKNAKANSFYEFKMNTSKIDSNSSDKERLSYISSKYKDKVFLKPPILNRPLSSVLLNGIKERDFNEMLWAIALGANIDMKLLRDDQEFSLLEYALSKPLVRDNLKVYDIAEFLVLNGANLPKEAQSKLPLHQSALDFLKMKIEKMYGTPSLKPGTKDPSSLNGNNVKSINNKTLKINTNLGDLDNGATNERKFSSPTAVTRNLIKKMTNGSNIGNTSK